MIERLAIAIMLTVSVNFITGMTWQSPWSAITLTAAPRNLSTKTNNTVGDRDFRSTVLFAKRDRASDVKAQRVGGVED